MIGFALMFRFFTLSVQPQILICDFRQRLTKSDYAKLQGERSLFTPSRLGLMILLFCLSNPGFAESPEAPAAEQLTLELIAFAYQNPVDLAFESWPINPGIPQAPLKMLPLPEPLPSLFFKLNDLEKKLRNSRDYRLLIHTAWQCPPGTAPIFFPLQAGKRWNNTDPEHPLQTPNFSTLSLPWELEGWLTLKSEHGPSLKLDLLLQEPATEKEITSLQPPYHRINPTDSVGWNLLHKTMLQSYRLEQSRRLKAKELYFFDHPAFGVLVMIH